MRKFESNRSLRVGKKISKITVEKFNLDAESVLQWCVQTENIKKENLRSNSFWEQY